MFGGSLILTMTTAMMAMKTSRRKIHYDGLRLNNHPLLVLRQVSNDPNINNDDDDNGIGRGWYAKQSIPAGTVIFDNEIPLSSAKDYKSLIKVVAQNLNIHSNLCRPAAAAAAAAASVLADDNNENIAAGIVKCNYFDCSTGSSTGASDMAAIFERISMFNHSCCPNASVIMMSTSATSDSGGDEVSNSNGSNNKRRTTGVEEDDEESKPEIVAAKVVVARPIKSNDQITVSYIGSHIFKTRDNRRRYIRERWGFDCHCDRCMNEFNNDDDVDGSFWSLVEDAAAISDANKPRMKYVPSSVACLQKQAAQAVSQRLPHWKEGERFATDAKYFE